MPIVHQLTNTIWLSLDGEVKTRLKEIFGIPKSSGARMIQVDGVGKLESDGHTNEDLAHVTLEKMAVFLGKEISNDFWGTLDEVVEKIEKELKMKNNSEIQKAVVGPKTVISEALAEIDKIETKKKK